MRILIILSLLTMAFMLGCVGPEEIPIQNQTEPVIINNSEPNPEPPNESLEEEVPSQAPVIEIGPQSVYVSLIEGGFEVPEVRIKVGETVGWKNEREGRQTRAMVLGTQWCSFVRSSFFGPGEVYRATFNRTGTCTVVDGMYTTEAMRVVVE